jgi:hypothetical protein
MGSLSQQPPLRCLPPRGIAEVASPPYVAPTFFGSAIPPLGSIASPRWAWRGAHSGAGVTTLARELGGADHGLSNRTGLPTLVVCRSTADGLMAAQGLAAGELAGFPTWTCLGLVVVAEHPGHLTKPLAELAALVAGGFPDHWSIPWVESWRRDPTTGRLAPEHRVWRPARFLHPYIRPIKEHP